MTGFYHIMGNILITVNLLGYVAVIIPKYRKMKLALIKENGYHLWQEQLDIVIKIAVGILLISI
jgi:hypothetical protein